MNAKEHKPAIRGFEINRTNWDGKYRHLRLKLFNLDDTLPRGFPDVRVSWQGDRSDVNWYACAVEMRAGTTAEAEMARKLVQALGEFDFSISPVVLIKRLVKKGWVQCVYDVRHNRVRPITEIEDGDRYVDDSAITGYRYCTMSVIASNADAACQMIESEFAAACADALTYGGDGTTYGGRFETWKRCGRPIILADRQPIVQSYAELLSVN